MVAAGDLDRRVQVRRKTLIDDGLQRSEVWADHGSPIWARREDVSDGERSRAGVTDARLLTRFTVRHDAFAATLTPFDRVTEGGRVFEIVGIKEVGRRAFLEITAASAAVAP